MEALPGSCQGVARELPGNCQGVARELVVELGCWDWRKLTTWTSIREHLDT
jgi:hypothetical protein